MGTKKKYLPLFQAGKWEGHSVRAVCVWWRTLERVFPVNIPVRGPREASTGRGLQGEPQPHSWHQQRGQGLPASYEFHDAPIFVFRTTYPFHPRQYSRGWTLVVVVGNSGLSGLCAGACSDNVRTVSIVPTAAPASITATTCIHVHLQRG